MAQLGRFSEDSSLERREQLRLVQARFLGTEPFNLDAFAGFVRLRVLTYSASIQMTVKMLSLFDQVECVFGYEGTLNSFSSVIAAQKEISEEVLMAVKGLGERDREQLLQKIAEGAARFFVVKDAVSHSKIYLLEGHL